MDLLEFAAEPSGAAAETVITVQQRNRGSSQRRRIRRTVTATAEHPQGGIAVLDDEHAIADDEAERDLKKARVDAAAGTENKDDARQARPVLVDYPDSEDQTVDQNSNAEEQDDTTQDMDETLPAEISCNSKIPIQDDDESTQSMSLGELEEQAPASSTTPHEDTCAVEEDSSDQRSTKRRLPNWMILSPVQIQQAEEHKMQSMRKNKEELRNQAAQTFGDENGLDNVAVHETETTVTVSNIIAYTEVFTPIEKGRVVIFDLETSGFSVEDSIIEIAGVELVDGQRTGVLFQSYAKARTAINPYAFQAHGLSEEFLAHHPPIEIVLNSFMRWLGSAPLVAHNLRFDIRMLCQELRRWDIPMNGNTIFCTMRYYRARLPGLAYSLDDLAAHYRIDRIIERRTHGALVDAEICARVYQKFLDALP